MYLFSVEKDQLLLMPSVDVINHNGAKLVINDMSYASPEEVISCCERSIEIMKQFGEGSAHVLANCTGMRFNSDVIQIVKNTTKTNRPYVRTTAVVGLEGFTKILVKVVISFSGRDMKICETEAEAKNWLAERYAEIEEPVLV
ncbi:hypothetical protein AB9P05_12060 [Roseivirga sp. BDSF3-8]|uniref:hypothetical protein n=1 Tax=Roseivirga sp. BDSF3-8 TaxID=3241598 RepID=UPI00353230DD